MKLVLEFIKKKRKRILIIFNLYIFLYIKQIVRLSLFYWPIFCIQNYNVFKQFPDNLKIY